MTVTETGAPESTAAAPRRPSRWLAVLPSISLLGVLALAVNAALSFEEPHPEMLVASGLLLLATPVGVLCHLAVTRDLTRAEKWAWLAGLTSGRAIAFLSAYVEAGDRRGALRHCARGPRAGPDCP